MILDVIAGTALLVGSGLIALGALGLVRFPDVFARMHAATKAATVGVIGTTAAAALEAGAPSGVLALLLVIALLFLSGPLGMSLLARAAYHDEETPRSPNTRELESRLPIPENTPVRRVAGASPFLAVWLFAVWLAVFGSVRPNVLIGGACVAGAVAFVLRRLAPRWPHAFVHPGEALRFVWHFSAQLVASTWDVIRALRLPPDALAPAVIEVPLRVRTRNEITLLMNAISFTPGTVALELHDHYLYVHVLSTQDPAGVIEEIRTMEAHIMAAFGTNEADVTGVT
jgi:monovalent cation/proton antiporter MnhG/PhaG subunit